ncbi:XerC/D-like integrase [Natrialba magadii ATCC 43099]|uniref:Integrase family protein n=1 Tax=Natrialba magadii (strain ATCC 43099 / DSM 3394 / CCM 3739 / CIP 104546 / IAM 13178 / JCM 8861 / NBRC 102185 / NCIMB 2190 / MS3) TaxID=547559 RepID=D3SY13_NATMM|nr:site-specific integrase [Natrialba magadii]ADD04053.1 XerC/D-like integrase [Natrialba magadii ATCC 43099]ELY33211.1 integrase family protein [Natrialba magadii ATCC 43099]
MKDADQATDPLEDITLIHGPTEELLNERQYLDYRSEREQCLEWLLAFGIDPKTADGYAKTTVSNRAYRMGQFYRWVWEQEGGYTTNLTHDHADNYLRHLAGQQKSNAHKNSCRKALMMLYKWRHHQRGADKWEPEITFSRKNQSTTPRDYLTRGERTAIRDASLEYGSVPRRDSVYGDERDRWVAYLAQRFEKPKADVTEADWERANKWKTPSLVAASLDGGLRPIEVERARTSWVDVDNGVLRIPKEESSKNAEHWIVSLQTQTVEMLDRWLTQRATIEKYDDTDALWLTRRSNPYQSASLRSLLHQLCEIADISTENRQMSWYAIRHSTGTYMAREEGLAAAQTQLRHKSPETTMKYDQAPIEDRKNALDRMG